MPQFHKESSMKKLAPKKLTLSRETVGLLEDKILSHAEGGATTLCTRTGCGDSGCVNSCFC